MPPDALEPLVTKIANEFVSEAAAAEVASAGLNAIREICVRQPLAMNDTLLQDLVMYRKSKDKGVMMAAKGLLSLYREVGAEMLKKRDRGKEAAMGLRSGERKERRYGEVEVGGGIEGLELLEKWKEEERRKKRIEKGLDPDGPDDENEAEDEDWNNWEVESDTDSDDSGGWINVEQDGEDIVISDSEDEKPPAKKAKKESDAEESAAKDPEAEARAAKEKEEAALKLATTRILTPADLQKLQELRLQAQVNSHLPAHRRANAAAKHSDDPLTAEEIEGLAMLSHRQTKEEKIARARADKPDKHQSTTAKRKEKKAAEGKSTTNKEKQRQKNFMMTLGKAKTKNKRSLTDVRKSLKGHLDRQKRGGKRGNYS